MSAVTGEHYSSTATAAETSLCSLTLDLLQGKVHLTYMFLPCYRLMRCNTPVCLKLPILGALQNTVWGNCKELCWSLANVTSRDNSKLPGFQGPQAERNHPHGTVHTRWRM